MPKLLPLSRASAELAAQFQYLPLWVYRRHAPRWLLPFEELQGAGFLGLVQAAGRWRQSGGASFKTFAVRRVYGAMRDEERQWRGHRHAHKAPVVVSLEATESFLQHPATLLAHPLDQLTEQDRERAIRRAITALPTKMRLVLVLHYWHEMPLSQIGDLLKLTESRMSQIRKQALQRLRPMLAGVA